MKIKITDWSGTVRIVECATADAVHGGEDPGWTIIYFRDAWGKARAYATSPCKLELAGE